MKQAFYKIPKILFTDEYYKNLSTDAKMLYVLLLDRNSLSQKMGWVDKRGQVFQYFTIKESQKVLHFGHEKICRLFKELEEINLIYRKRQGQGRPSIIYVNNAYLISKVPINRT